MDFKTIDPVEGLRQHLFQRLNQLENEYLSNQAAIIVVEAVLAGTTPSETDQAELAKLTNNLAIIEKAHAAVAAEHEKFPGAVDPAAPVL